MNEFLAEQSDSDRRSFYTHMLITNGVSINIHHSKRNRENYIWNLMFAVKNIFLRSRFWGETVFALKL